MQTLQLSGITFGAAFLVAAADWLAVARHAKRLEYILKPATLLITLMAAWLLTQGAHDPWLARFFLVGLACSLAGDVFLMLPSERFFLPGLAVFLLAHLGYIVGLNPTWPPLAAVVLLPVIALIGWLLFTRIVAGLRRAGQARLIAPVAIYSLVISLMLFAAWATLFRAEWTPTRRALVIVGATLFFMSDAMLAWDRFVRPSPAARLRVMITYHLAQVALAATIALW